MAERDDLRLSLSLSTSESHFPLKLTLFPSLTCIHSDEEEMEAWSPVSTLPRLNGKRCDREQNEGEDGGENSPKKLRLSKDQTAVLEESFEENNTLNPKQKQALAERLSLRPRQVEVWFQNRRARTKLKQTEVECEHLKRWCEKLAEENKRLQNEITELRTVNRVTGSHVTLPSQQQYHVNLSGADPWAFYFHQTS